MKRALVLVAITLFGAQSAQARVRGGSPIALVTAETQNQLIAVDLPSGHILRRLSLPADPQNIEVTGNTAIVISPRAGAVTLVDVESLRVRKILRGFGSPHIAAVTPDGNWAYVTDDERGQLDVIELARGRVVRRVFVGRGAHHMGTGWNSNRLWVALGERARTIVIVDTTRLGAPRVLSRFAPRFDAHDLAFSPDGTRVWVTSDDSAYVTVFSAFTARALFRVYGGAAPQHVAFWAGAAYVTSGNDGTLRYANPRTGKLRRTVTTSYGSFNLGVGGSLVLTSSLYRGTLTELDSSGHRLLQTRVAESARDVALAVR
jgi:DNA-binding beta-propeller fold protein YncE